MGAHPARDGGRSRRIARPSTARVRHAWTGARRNAGTSPRRRVRAFRVCETHPALDRVARANRCGDLRTFCSEPGLSNGRYPPPAGAIPLLHLADRRGLHDAQVEGKARKLMRDPRISIEEYAAIIRVL